MDLSHPDAWCAHAIELGADAAKTIDTDKVVVAEWVRLKCLYGCDEPGVHKTCPPDGAPALDVIRRLLGEFRRGVLLTVGPITGSERSDPESRRSMASPWR